MIREMKVPVGRRGMGDRKAREIPGTLIMPEKRSDTLVVLVCGTSGHHQDYVPHLGASVGQEFNVYVTELRKRGLCKDTYMPDDIAQIDNFLRDMTEAENVFYAGHSTGMGVAAAAMNKHDLQVMGMYGMSAFPSFGDSRTSDPDPKVRSLSQKITDMMAVSRMGPYACPLKESSIDVPVRFVIPGSDIVLKTDNDDVSLRFHHFFDMYPDSSCIQMMRRNHCFNYGHKDYAPFNKDDPQVLVNDLLAFVSHVSACNDVR